MSLNIPVLAVLVIKQTWAAKRNMCFWWQRSSPLSHCSTSLDKLPPMLCLPWACFPTHWVHTGLPTLLSLAAMNYGHSEMVSVSVLCPMILVQYREAKGWNSQLLILSQTPEFPKMALSSGTASNSLHVGRPHNLSASWTNYREISAKPWWGRRCEKV